MLAVRGAARWRAGRLGPRARGARRPAGERARQRRPRSGWRATTSATPTPTRGSRTRSAGRTVAVRWSTRSWARTSTCSPSRRPRQGLLHDDESEPKKINQYDDLLARLGGDLGDHERHPLQLRQGHLAQQLHLRRQGRLRGAADPLRRRPGRAGRPGLGAAARAQGQGRQLHGLGRAPPAQHRPAVHGLQPAHGRAPTRTTRSRTSRPRSRSPSSRPTTPTGCR